MNAAFGCMLMQNISRNLRKLSQIYVSLALQAHETLLFKHLKARRLASKL